MGDLVVTCWHPSGRNRRAGELIARGESQEQALAEIGQVVEGLTTAPVLRALSHRLGSRCRSPRASARCSPAAPLRAGGRPDGAGPTDEIATAGVGALPSRTRFDRPAAKVFGRVAPSPSRPSRSPKGIPTRSPTRSRTPFSTRSSPRTRSVASPARRSSRPASSSSPARSRRATYVDIPRLVRDRISQIGYTRAKFGFDAETCGVIVALDEQSPDIAQGVDTAFEVQHDAGDGDPLDRVGAGDQGLMFGYATERDAGAHAAADHARAQAREAACGGAQGRHAPLPAARRQDPGDGALRGRRARAQTPVEIERVLVSTQHREASTRRRRSSRT